MLRPTSEFMPTTYTVAGGIVGQKVFMVQAETNTTHPVTLGVFASRDGAEALMASVIKLTAVLIDSVSVRIVEETVQ